MLSNISEERRSHVHCGGILKSEYRSFWHMTTCCWVGGYGSFEGELLLLYQWTEVTDRAQLR